MKTTLGIICLCVSLWAGEWVMFSDGKDTYIYSTQTGEIYIRHHLGKKNYEDIFVKMPRGMQPKELQNTSQAQPFAPLSPNDEQLKKMQLDALKKSQEILNATLD